ncbi:MAG: hypothetical protein V4561_06630 [Bacteroidota bacterium]
MDFGVVTIWGIGGMRVGRLGICLLVISMSLFASPKSNQKGESKTRRLLKHQNAEARHRRYFLMFRSAALKKWQSQHSYRCVLDGAPIDYLSTFCTGTPHRCHSDEGGIYTCYKLIRK